MDVRSSHDLRGPYLSPLFGDFSKGFPPTILTAGTRDIFLSNTVLMHRARLRAGIEAELHVWEGMPHGDLSPKVPALPRLAPIFQQLYNR